ncbi:MAG: ATP-binding protein [Candidatus Atribacteria bacterium]|nr:ATP-binding protein [Candidatus Atribacteria bacterium]
MSDKFYLGRLYDSTQAKVTDQPLQYDPADLTTHAVVTGMTGSGKTGLCIALMEEAALQGIPAILIDPKGDLTNLLLHFPDLAPQDFQPWLDPDLARRAGKSVEQVSTDAALAWRNGLAEWGITHERMLALKNAAEFAIYTPGSDAGIPVSVLSSLAAPGLDWASNREVLTERISSTVTAILGLVGFDELDPIRSREHILLSNIFQSAWSQNKSLDLTELILQIQSPPFDKLGVFPVDTFFPAKDRMALALQINNILAAPAFELWRIGQPLDIAALLRAPDGRPRHSVFYLAHLSDAERMFFVTLLLSAVETWMRTQSGATSLRALLYMDEIFGYLPPTANPPSKLPLLRMLKQARAFGLGLLLATQNPVDVDYKALSNAGTWFIGKLQTEQDKQRLLDGLESVAAGALDRGTIDKLISGLGKRVFIMQNVHEKLPIVYQTRWTMNFLAGPMTRSQIPALNKLVGASFQPSAVNSQAPVPLEFVAPLPGFEPIPAPVPVPVQPVPSPTLNRQLPSGTMPPAGTMSSIVNPQSSLTRPSAPAGIAEFFLPLNLSFTKAVAASGESLPADSTPAGLLYRPALIACAQVRFLDRKYNLDSEQVKSALVANPDKRGVIRWDDFVATVPDAAAMDPAPDPQARFASLDAPLSEAKLIAVLQRDFADWVYRTSKITVRSNQALGLYATPDVSQAEFMKACADAARVAREAAMAKATTTLDRQIAALNEKLNKEQRELQQDQTELEERKREELVSGAETVFSLLGGHRSRRISSAMSKHRMTQQSKGDVTESVDAIAEYKQQLAQLEQTRLQALDEAGSKWGDVVNDITEIPVLPKKTDIYFNLFGVAWVPYYQVKSGDQTVEIPAYQ